jgi:RimJ/RimL family protein N-acetyltransferase
MIETERLMIRPWHGDDIALWKAMAKDIGYNVFTPPGVYFVKDDAHAAKRVAERMKIFADARIGKMPVFEKASGEFVGTCGADFFDLDGASEIEIGYRLMLEHWGKGYATEAARAMTRYLLTDAGFAKIHAFVHRHNRASENVIRKIGYTFAKDFLWANLPHKLYLAER